MAIIVKHPFISAEGDSTEPGKLQPSHWNADHIITGVSPTNGPGQIEPFATGTLTVTGDITVVGNGSLRGCHGPGDMMGVAIGDNALESNTNGMGNTAVGAGALADNTGGSFNTALGQSTLSLNQTASQNTAVGSQALMANTQHNNTAVGARSLRDNSVGTSNTAIGVDSLLHNMTGSENSAVGLFALVSNISGVFNTAVGSLALQANIGSNNTAVGTHALVSNTTGADNIAIGLNSGDGITTGSGNTIIGTNLSGLPSGLTNNIIFSNGSGDWLFHFDGSRWACNSDFYVMGHIAGSHGGGDITSCLAIGTAMASNEGQNNTGVGFSALAVNATGHDNTALGTASLFENVTGNNNSCIGSWTGFGIESGSNNTVVGGLPYDMAAALGGDTPPTLGVTTGSGNTILGANVSGLAAGLTNNIIIANGTGAIKAQHDGTDWTLTGDVNISGAGSLTGSYGTGGIATNVAVGDVALNANTTGYENTAIGENVLPVNTTGSQNTGVGSKALQENTTGGAQTGVGWAALKAATTGGSNAAFGHGSLSNLTIGSYNTGHGRISMYRNVSGNNNTAVGYNSAPYTATGSNNTAVGTATLSTLRTAYIIVSTNTMTNGLSYRIVRWDGANQVASRAEFVLAGATTGAKGEVFQYNGYSCVYAGEVVLESNVATQCQANTVVGANSGTGITTGSGNTILGANVVGLAATLANNIILANGTGVIKAQHDGTNWALTGTTAVTGSITATTGATIGATAANATMVEADGTLKFAGTATVWNDAFVDGMSLHGGSTDPPIFAAIGATTIFGNRFDDAATMSAHGSIEIPHDYLEGSSLYFHLHFLPTTTFVGNIRWGVEWMIANVNGDFTAVATSYVAATTAGVALRHQIADLVTISGTNRKISDVLHFRVFRDGTNGADTFTGNVFLSRIAVHYECDMVGSRSMATKA